MEQEEFKIALIRAGLTQHELALRLGVHPATISRIMSGIYVPPDDTQRAFRSALGEHGHGLVFGFRLREVTESMPRNQADERAEESHTAAKSRTDTADTADTEE